MPQSFCTTRRVEFRDTDAAGIMHFSAFFVLMEEVEHQFLRECGTSVVLRDEQGVISWPRIEANCRYQSAVRFEDELEIELRIERLGSKAVTYAFDFRCAGRPVASGRMAAVCCRIEEDQPPRSIPIPEWLLSKLAPYAPAEA